MNMPNVCDECGVIVDCPQCDGAGRIDLRKEGYDIITCSMCKGDGYIQTSNPQFFMELS